MGLCRYWKPATVVPAAGVPHERSSSPGLEPTATAKLVGTECRWDLADASAAVLLGAANDRPELEVVLRASRKPGCYRLVVSSPRLELPFESVSSVHDP